MEPRIDKGVMVTDGLGMPEVRTGVDALLQRVYNRLNMRRGCFCYAPNLGSRIPDTAEWDGGVILQFAQEALLSCGDVRVKDAVLFDDRAEIRVETPMGSGTVTVYRKENEDDI